MKVYFATIFSTGKPLYINTSNENIANKHHLQQNIFFKKYRYLLFYSLEHQ